MSQEEYKDRQELQEGLRDDYEKIETLGKELEGHQKDLEHLKKLKSLRSKNGLYTDSNSFSTFIEEAINTRESSVETCKEQIKEVADQVKPKLDNLKRNIARATQRVEKMEDIVNKLNHPDIAVDVNVEINQEKDNADEAKTWLEKGTELLTQTTNFLTAGSMTATALGQALGGIYNTLQAMGFIR
jgi:chromosome segregation ATPase